MGKVVMSGIVPKLSEPVIPVKEIPAGDLAVGNSVYLNVNGVKTAFLVVHRGLPSSAYDNSCDGVWLLMKDVYTKRTAKYSYANWVYANTNMHTYVNSTGVS